MYLTDTDEKLLSTVLQVRAQARLTLDTVEAVVTAVPDMTEVFAVMTRLRREEPGAGLLEVIGPVFCNTTRHFLLIQVQHDLVPWIYACFAQNFF